MKLKLLKKRAVLEIFSPTNRWNIFLWAVLFSYLSLFNFFPFNRAFAQEASTTQQLLDQVKALQQNTTASQPNQTTNLPSTLPMNANAPAALPNLPTLPVQPTAPTLNNAGRPLAQTSNIQPPQITETPSPPPSSIPTRNNLIVPFQGQALPQTVTSQAMSQSAFAGAIHSILPMSPEQIHRLRELYSAAQYAAAAPAGIPPKPTATSLFVDLSPGATPPAINLAEGDITALVFLDSTGAPWPIEALDNGNPSAFDIQWNKKDNVLLVQATSSFGRGNIAIRLKQLGPPVMLTMLTNSTMQGAGGVVDYRVDLRIPGYGPNAIPLAGSSLPSHPTPLLLNVLDGIPPDGSKALELSDSAGQAWILNDSIYLRTRLTLLSPAWVSIMSSADGTHAYQLQKTPLLLMSEHGKVIQVKLKGF